MYIIGRPGIKNGNPSIDICARRLRDDFPEEDLGRSAEEGSVTSKERVQMAVAHEPPDHAPSDLPPENWTSENVSSPRV